VPGAGTGIAQGTNPIAIAANGKSVGNFIDGNGAYHGYRRNANQRCRKRDRQPETASLSVRAPIFRRASTKGSSMRHLQSTARILCSGICLALAAGSSAHAQAWLTFDVPEATTVSPVAITANNTIVGTYTMSDSTAASFLRTSDGTLTAFNLVDGGSTQASSADRYDDIAGTVSAVGGSQGFLRTADGQATLFSVGGATVTEATGLNDKGWIAGDYVDPSTSKRMGFLRKPDGGVKTFASPDGSDIAVRALNNKNTIVGTYGTHGFIRDAKGNITTFRLTANYIVPVAINNGGMIAGYYQDTSGKIHGFVRQSNGTLSGFNAPSSANGNFVTGLNDSGIVVGWCKDSANLSHGFALDTSISKSVPLNAPNGTNGTELLAIGRDGKMAGFYYDASNVAHAVRANAAQTGF
jgi:hypothetical protein